MAEIVVIFQFAVHFSESIAIYYFQILLLVSLSNIVESNAELVFNALAAEIWLRVSLIAQHSDEDLRVISGCLVSDDSETFILREGQQFEALHH